MITEIDTKTALILIDLQKGIVSLPLAHPAENVINKAVMLMDAFHAKGWPVILVHVNPLGAKWTQTRAEQSTAPKSPEAIAQAKEKMENAGFFHLTPQLTTADSDICITKSGWNAFYGTDIDAKLKQLGITGIVLAGVSTSIGVEGTARSASERGYNITFAQDAMTDRHLSAHENSLKYIFPRIGEIGDTKTIIEKITAL